MATKKTLFDEGTTPSDYKSTLALMSNHYYTNPENHENLDTERRQKMGRCINRLINFLDDSEKNQ